MAQTEGVSPFATSEHMEEDLLDLQENLARDPKSLRRTNVILVCAYLLIVFFLVAGAVTLHHWTHR